MFLTNEKINYMGYIYGELLTPSYFNIKKDQIKKLI
ncbi:hypothetical protein JOE44_000871 [Chryseobacterium sp. PvR013]|nr:hypothetical protein [Chryseobacterium sp. PvR013]